MTRSFSVYRRSVIWPEWNKADKFIMTPRWRRASLVRLLENSTCRWQRHVRDQRKQLLPIEVKKSTWAERVCRPLSNNTHQHHAAILKKEKHPLWCTRWNSDSSSWWCQYAAPADVQLSAGMQVKAAATQTSHLNRTKMRHRQHWQQLHRVNPSRCWVYIYLQIFFNVQTSFFIQECLFNVMTGWFFS